MPDVHLRERESCCREKSNAVPDELLESNVVYKIHMYRLLHDNEKTKWYLTAVLLSDSLVDFLSQIILGSKSVARRKILADMGYQFTVMVSLPLLLMRNQIPRTCAYARFSLYPNPVHEIYCFGLDRRH